MVAIDLALSSVGRPAARESLWRRAFGGRMERALVDDFEAFAHAAAPRLRRTAFLMCQDWHLAQDLTQITLAKMYVNWPRVRQSASVEAYSRKVLMNALFDHRRKRSGGEVAIPQVPDRSDPAGNTPELRITLIQALKTLSDRDRAIVILRYWEDQSVESVAEVLDISVSVVKTQSLRSLARLRALLGDNRAELLTEA